MELRPDAERAPERERQTAAFVFEQAVRLWPAQRLDDPRRTALAVVYLAVLDGAAIAVKS